MNLLRVGVVVAVGVSLMGCSDTRRITSKREALTPKIDAITAARATAKSFAGGPSKPAVPIVVSDKAPFDSESNTLIIEDVAIDGFATEIDPKGLHPRSQLEIGAGDDCAADAASVLRFGHFRDDAPHAGADGCASWLARLAYVVVIPPDSKSSSGADLDTHARGYAVVVALDGGKALGRIPFDESSKGRFENVVNVRTGAEGIRVVDAATGTANLVRAAVSEGLEKTFPGTRFVGYRPTPR